MTINKVSKEFKDGVADAVVYGVRNDNTFYLTSHDYNNGYDFSDVSNDLHLFAQMQTFTRENEILDSIQEE